MRHRNRVVQLSRPASHRKALFANMLTSLFRHERIETTLTKAKALKPLADKMVTKMKKGDLHSRRQILRTIKDKALVKKMCDQMGPLFENRHGGYTRIVKLGFRKGDNAPLAFIELVEKTTVGSGSTTTPAAENGAEAKTTSSAGSVATHATTSPSLGDTDVLASATEDDESGKKE